MRKTPAAIARALYVELIASPERERREVIRKFLRSLALARKSSLKPRIMRAFNQLALAVEGKKAGTITTATAMDHTTSAQIAKHFPHVIFEIAVDQSLIGGAVVRVGDEVRDGSVHGRIESLKRVLQY
jgi:F-type H+-transporting ATPase subunit delta